MSLFVRNGIIYEFIGYNIYNMPIVCRYDEKIFCRTLYNYANHISLC